MNFKQKRVVLYIHEPMENLSSKEEEDISKVKGMGVRVVNSLKELEEVMELWEHPSVS